MAEERAQRRLAAIMAADVVGYSRLIGADETGTRTRFKSHLSDLIEPSVREYRGRIVKMTGDGLLVEFPSVVDATECAIQIQRGMSDRTADEDDAIRIRFRIAVHVGDVIVEDDDIHGDGVNVASRLEGIADPGGICISEDAFRQVGGRLKIGYADLGAQSLKNIERPIRAYRVLFDDFDPTPDATAPKAGGPKRRWLPATAALIVVAVAIAGVAWWSDRAPVVERASAEVPSIAVLPFANISGDKRQEYFSDGITEDIITDLSKLSALFVVARDSSFRYKGRVVDIEKVGRELGARYLLEGSVRRAGDQVRINVQLVDARTGGQVWAERYDGKFANTFSLQDKVTHRIIAALSLKLGAKERVVLADHGTNNFEAHDAYLKGQRYFRQYTPEGFALATKQFERAVELDPQYTRAADAIAQVRHVRENSGLQ